MKKEIKRLNDSGETSILVDVSLCQDPALPHPELYDENGQYLGDNIRARKNCTTEYYYIVHPNYGKIGGKMSKNKK